MANRFFPSLAAVAILLAANSAFDQARGETPLRSMTCERGCCGGCTACGSQFCNGCTGRAWLFDVEFTLVEYGQEGGVTDLIGSPATFGWELAPRIELGYEAGDGLGARARYWFYDHGATSQAGGLVDVDTYYVDFELYQRYDVFSHTDIEISGGVRYLDFQQFLADAVPVSAVDFGTHAFGGIVALEARRHLSCGALYARGRWGILQGDATVQNVVFPGPIVVPFSANNNTIQQLEVAFGYEIARETNWGLITARIGGEWQQWSNVAIADTAFGGVGNDDVLEDASFAGLVLAVGLER